MWLATTVEDLGKFNSKRYQTVKSVQGWLQKGHRMFSLKILLGLAATILGGIALIVSASLQRNAEAKAEAAKAEAEAASRQRQRDELTSTGCAIAREIKD